MASNGTEPAEQAGRTLCPSCCEPIHRAARKCPHCGEPVHGAAPRTFQDVTKKVVAVLGVATATLSVIFGLREGYFFIKQSEAQRTLVASQRAAAQQLKAMDNLHYAVMALDRALAVRPDDQDLRRERFLLKAHATLRDIEDEQVSPHARSEEVTSLALEGFQVLHAPLSDEQRARVLTMLGRCLQQDASWTKREEITALFETARRLAPSDAEVAFRFGKHRLAASETSGTAPALLAEATRLAPGNALYWYELGKTQRDAGQIGDALRAFGKAAALLPEQKELQTIRAAETARQDLGRDLVAAHEKYGIASVDFLGLSHAERRSLLMTVLEPSNLRLQFVAAQFFYATGDDESAARAAKASLWYGGDERERIRASASQASERLKLYEAILTRWNKDPASLALVSQALRDRAEAEREYAERQRYQTVLDIGRPDKHRYKIGLKTLSGRFDDGIPVVEAHEGYPFARAGIVAGDRILKVAHRSVHDLRDIWRLIIEFQPGAELPVAINRDGKESVVTLRVE